MIMDNKVNDDPIFHMLGMLVQQPLRLIFTISFMGKLHRSSDELLSSVARLFFNSRHMYSLDEEERQIVRDFLNRMNQVKLAACPSGFYEIKPAIFLTILSLIVTYTAILLQTNNGSANTTLGENITSIVGAGINR